MYIRNQKSVGILFSIAGKRRGKEDDRYLWPEMLRVISEIRPRWVVGENVAGIVNMALDQVLSDLEGIGYTCEALVFPACAVDAPHRRDRVCIVAHCNSPGFQEERSEQQTAGASGSCEVLADPDVGTMRNDGNDIRETVGKVNTPNDTGFSCGKTISNTSNRRKSRKFSCRIKTRRSCSGLRRSVEPVLGGMDDGISSWLDRGMSKPGWWLCDPFPDVPRVAKGVPNRANRLKCLGNAVVPQQFYPIFQAIADVERLAENGQT